MKDRARPGEEERWPEWMAQAQRGDRSAYERLLRSVLPHLRAFVRMRMRDPSAAEDVVQNVLLSIHQARHTYRPERPFRPWLRAIARNAVIDALRARGVRARYELAFEDLEALAGSQAPEPAEALSPSVARALAELPPSQREAVELLHIHELSSVEAARRLGISPVALRVRAHRGRRALRARLLREEL
jgi:RNA polymerase sigma-70 factor (ECF subfamily)